MSVDGPELRDLLCRVERLESQNRWLRRVGLAVVVLVGSVVALGAAHATPMVPQKIVAHEFDVVDSTGNVRIKLRVNQWGAARVSVMGADGTAVAEMIASGQGASNDIGSVLLRDEHGDSLIATGATSIMHAILIQGVSPGIELSDKDGYKMDLGSTNTVIPATGQTQHTSAASIVMFGNGKTHKVIWQAPEP